MTAELNVPLANGYNPTMTDSVNKPDETPYEGAYPLVAEDLSIYYGDFRAIKHISLNVEPKKITSIIGPSGCGKSTLLRAFNRMNDLVPTARVDGKILYHGKNLYDPDVDPVEVRRQIGMVFQKPNPFPKTIYENIAWGARINGLSLIHI